MISKLKKSSKHYGLKTVVAIGIPFLVAGFLMASGLQWTNASLAGELPGKTQPSSLSASAVPGSFAELAERLSPTVVNVKVVKVETAAFSGPQMPDGPFGDFFERFFEGMPQGPKSRKSMGAGSGVIIGDDGTVLTNNHVIEGASQVTVTFADGKTYDAQVLGSDPKTDLAVLKIETDKPLPAAVLGNSEQLRVGDWVVAIGNPFGLSHTVTSGIVSAKGRVIGAGPYDDFIQTDASINPGNSGGPLFNTKGEVVGINTAIIAQGQGIGFAIPVNTAKPLIPQLVANGSVTRGYLGVSIQTISDKLADALNLEDRKGALVTDVAPDGPADGAGIKRGDIVKSFDGKTVADSRSLPAMVSETPVGKEVPVRVLRDGKEQALSVKVGKLPSEQAGLENTIQPTEGKWGLQLHELSPRMAQQFGLQTDQGVLVVGVGPDSPAQEAGIRQGDVIVEVNRKAVASVADIKETIDESGDNDHMLLLVQREGGKFYVPLERQG